MDGTGGDWYTEVKSMKVGREKRLSVLAYAETSRTFFLAPVWPSGIAFPVRGVDRGTAEKTH